MYQLKLLFSIIVCSFSFLPNQGNAASVFGTVRNAKNEPLPFASIYIRNSTTGTSANSDGDYKLILDAGQYEIVFQYLGFEQHLETVVLKSGENLQINIVLKQIELKIRDAVVTADEDPAYKIMREVIALRKTHLEEMTGYSCDTYLKALYKLNDVPEKIFGLKMSANGENIDTNDLGVLYFSESQSKLFFEKPDHFKEIMYSSKVSGEDQGFSWNQAAFFMFNFYENKIDLDFISDREFISPVADNAMFYYQYRLINTYQEDGKTVSEIKVKPKRDNDPVFHGTLWIVEGDWRIQSADMVVKKSTVTQFIDTFGIKQVLIPHEKNVWVPFQQKITFHIALLGIDFGGYNLGIYQNYDVNPVFDEKLFNNEVMKVEDQANLKTNIYWDTIRPVPLTDEEQTDYIKKDSIATIHGSKEWKDSVAHERNKLKWNNTIFGYSYYNLYHEWSMVFSSLIENIQYNSVEGLNLSMRVRFVKEKKEKRLYEIPLSVRYGFSNTHFNSTIGLNWFGNKKKISRWEFEAGKNVFQFNDQNPISPLINTSYSLTYEQNYMKIYEKWFGRAYFIREVANGVVVSAGAEYSYRLPLQNITDFSFVDRENIEFSSNDPLHYTNQHYSFERHQALDASVSIRFRFAQKYYTRPEGKINLVSKYPELRLSYTKSFKNIFGSDLNFDLLQIKVSDDMQFGLFGSMNYSLAGGQFINSDSIAFIDFKHFYGNKTIFLNNPSESFQLLDYYQYSTNNRFLEAHVEHHFEGFLFNKIPLFRKLKWQEVAGFHYLFTDVLTHYFELNFGVERIFKFIRADFVMSFNRKEKKGAGVRLGFNF